MASAAPILDPTGRAEAVTQAIQGGRSLWDLSPIHNSEPTRLRRISNAVFCLEKEYCFKK